jgi:hypothetical protein
MISAAGILAVGLGAGSGAAFAGEANGPAGAVPRVATPKATNGSVKCTASVNADGSILACKHCNPGDTNHIDTGEYQIGFNKPCQSILAVNGWSRWTQVDTLATSSLGGYCTTADRSGDVNAVFVECFDNSGTPADTSFFLFVAK